MSFTNQQGTFIPVERSKTELEGSIKTTQMEVDPAEQIEKAGTLITIEGLKKDDYDKAIVNFLALREDLQLLAASPKGDVYRNTSGNGAEIFLNGMKIATDEDFLFSYHIKEPNKKLQRSLNRENKNLPRDCYRENIITILKSNINNRTQTLIDELIDSRDQYDNGEWSFIDVKKLIGLNTNRNILWADSSSKNIEKLIYSLYGMDTKKYEILALNSLQYRSMENDDRLKKQTLMHVSEKLKQQRIEEEAEKIKVKEQKPRKRFEEEDLPIEDLNPIEREGWDWAMEKARELCGFIRGWEKLYEEYQFVLMEKNHKYVGLCYTDQKIIKLSRGILKDEYSLLNTLVHEICHATTNGRDGTKKFERGLTDAFHPLFKLGQSK